jgi:tRNA pseudouridine13 synthase
MPFDPLAPPLLTADLPGIGGHIKTHPEDFEVEEVPAYEPAGTGPHLYLWVEKRDLGADFLRHRLAERLGVRPDDVGTAGMKDRRAVTRQWVSVPESAEPRLKELDGDGLKVLRVSRHANKLKPGHLRGNRFRILVRDVTADAAERLPPLLDRLRTMGLPNYYGPQRFGHEGETLRLGMTRLRGERTRRLSTFLFKLALSAAQSGLFNDYLARRIADGLFRTVLSGDVMAKWPFGGMFVVEDVPREQERFDARETVHAGPMFGRKTFAAAGVAAEREEAVLREAGLTREAFGAFGKLMMGTRRHNVIYPDDVTAAVEPEGVRLSFGLPAGSYATVLLAELMKVAVPEGEDEEAEPEA